MVDDEPQLLESYRRVLARAGFDVATLHHGGDVADLIARQDFDVVICDIGVPVSDGLDVLRAVRALDRDLPVVLMTKRGGLTQATGALEHGVHRYLVKPIEPAMLCRAAEDGVALRRGARLRAAALDVYRRAASDPVERALLLRRFEQALRLAYVAYQPIVSWSTLSVVAYEALLRTHEPTFASPVELLAAAEALGRLHDVGRTVRVAVDEALMSLPAELSVFVNLHPVDFADSALFEPTSPLSRYASRVVLEVTERDALSHFGDLAGYAKALRKLGYRLAVDDFGSGRGGLSALVQLRPDIVKIDMTLVHGVDSDHSKRRAVENALSLCVELGIQVVAEGVETTAQRDTLVAAGYDLMQGHLFARPGRLTPSMAIAPSSVSPSRSMPRPDAELFELKRIQGQLDCAPLTVVRLDRHGIITHVNAAWREFARSNGADERTTEGVGLDYRAVLAGGDLATAAALADLLADRAESFTSVYACHSPTAARWFRLDAKRVPSDDAVIVMHTDVTEQHAAEARLRLQSVVANTLAEPLSMVDALRRFVRSLCDDLEWDFAALWLEGDGDRLSCKETWSRAALDPATQDALVGCNLARGEGLPGRAWLSQEPEWISDLRLEPGLACPCKAPVQSLQTGLAVPLMADGEVFAVVELFSKIQRANDPALVELVANSGARLGARALRQRAEQRAATAEAAQREVRATLDAIMECIPAFILVVDQQHRIRFINRAFPNLKMEDVIGSDSTDYLPPATREKHRQGLERILATGVSETSEAVVEGPDGTICLSTHASPLRQGDTITGVVLVTYDITELKRTTAELSATQRMAAVGTLAAGVAHEINTPIQFVNDSVHFLRDASHDAFQLIQDMMRVLRVAQEGRPASELLEAVATAAAREANADLPYLRVNVPKAFERCLDGLSRVSTIVRSLKEFAHPAQDEMAPTDLNRAIQTTLTIARTEYKYVAELETSFGAIPPVVCFINDLNQVVLNLVVNAAHAIADVVRGTSMLGRITVRTWHDADHVFIAVGDTGSGIPMAIRHRIFEPFFTTKEVGRGTGQGLAHAWTVVKTKHGGDLTFESFIGRGTTFTIKLPINGKAKPAVARKDAQ